MDFVMRLLFLSRPVCVCVCLFTRGSEKYQTLSLRRCGECRQGGLSLFKQARAEHVNKSQSNPHHVQFEVSPSLVWRVHTKHRNVEPFFGGEPLFPAGKSGTTRSVGPALGKQKVWQPNDVRVCDLSSLVVSHAQQHRNTLGKAPFPLLSQEQ